MSHVPQDPLQTDLLSPSPKLRVQKQMQINMEIQNMMKMPLNSTDEERAVFIKLLEQWAIHGEK